MTTTTTPALSDVLDLARRVRAPERGTLARRDDIIAAGRFTAVPLMLKQRASDDCADASEAVQAGDMARARALRGEVEDILWALGIMAIWGRNETAALFETIVLEWAMGFDEAVKDILGVTLVE